MAWRGATRAQACDAARPFLPAATESTVGIVCSSQAMEGMVRRLLADPLEESNETGRLLLREVAEGDRRFFEARGFAGTRACVGALFPGNEKGAREASRKPIYRQESEDFSKEVTLVDYSLKDELDLVPGMLFRN